MTPLTTISLFFYVGFVVSENPPNENEPWSPNYKKMAFDTSIYSLLRLSPIPINALWTRILPLAETAEPTFPNYDLME
ncbi:20008_t:CDS:1, partial [Funneliformis geosporum]